PTPAATQTPTPAPVRPTSSPTRVPATATPVAVASPTPVSAPTLTPTAAQAGRVPQSAPRRLGSASAPTEALDPPELRAVWVDAFHDGFKTPQQVDDLVAWARDANLNALFVQVRRRGDAYYLKSFEPRAEDPDLAPGFD